MTRHYPDLGSTSDWSCRVGNLFQPIRSTIQNWVVTRHQYGISALVSQTSFGGKTSGSVAKCRLFSQASYLWNRGKCSLPYGDGRWRKVRVYFIPFIRAPYSSLRNSSERSSLFFLSMSGANNGLPDVMALMLVDGFMKLVLTLGPHPNAPLELYMNKGDRLDDRKWHTVQVIRELKVSKREAFIRIT